jgi:hypothetical protein
VPRRERHVAAVLGGAPAPWIARCGAPVQWLETPDPAAERWSDVIVLAAVPPSQL